MNLEQNVLQVHIEDIIPNRFQPRLNFDEQGLQELAASIKEHGIIQPLVLRKLGDKYEIIAGERRYKAATMAGLTTVPAVIANIDDNKSAEVALVENVQRRDLTAIEEARSYKNLLDKGYLTQEQLAKRMGLSQPAVANKLRLLNLDDEVQQALLEEKISERHARTLLTLPPEEQREWLHRIINERLTVRQLDLELKKAKGIDDNEDASGEVPLVTAIPSIEDIKANAMDINEINNSSQSEELETTDLLEEPTIASPSTNNFEIKSELTTPEFKITTPHDNKMVEKQEYIPTNNNNKFFNSIPETPTTEPVFATLEHSTQPIFNFNNQTGADTNNFEVFDAGYKETNPFMEINIMDQNPTFKPAPEFNKTPTIIKPEFNSQINPTEQMEINPNNRFFTPISRTTSTDATIINPTVTNTNINPMARVDLLKPESSINDNFEETSTSEESSATGEPKDLKYCIDQTRTFIDKLGSQGFYIDVEEIDFPEAYQITMRIHKDN